MPMMTEQERYEKAKRLRDQLGMEGETVVGLMAQNQDPRVEAVKRIKEMMQPASQPDVMAPPPIESQPYLQAEGLEREAQPRNYQPRGIKENFIAGIQGSFHPQGYQGMMLQKGQLERQREQDLLSRAQQLRGQGFQQQQLYRQDQNSMLNREQDAERLKLEKAKHLFEQEKSGRPQLAEITAGASYGSRDPVTGAVNLQGQAPPNAPAPRAPRTVTTEEGVFTMTPEGGLGQRLGDRPRPAGREGTITPNAESNLVNKLSGEWQKAAKDVSDLYRANTIMNAGLDAARKGDLNAGAQAVLITFQKFLDPTSVVRESEYARSAQGLSMANRISGYMERLSKGGAGVTLPELETFAGLAQDINSRLAAEGNRLVSAQKTRLGSIAKRYNIPEDLIFPAYDYAQPGGVPQPTQGGACPQPGTVENGYVFQGGDPANPNSWKKQ